MATLEKIRSKGPLVAIVIGLALLAFVLGDAVRSSGTLFSQSQNQVAEAEGSSVSIQDYQKRIQEVNSFYESIYGGALNTQMRERLREQAWQDIVRSNVMSEQYEEVGIGVSSDELFELVQGDNPAPLVRQLFSDNQTGRFNREQLMNTLRALNYDNAGQTKDIWLYIEDQVLKNQRFKKYNTIVSQGLYVPTPMAEHDMKSKERTYSFDYLALKASSVADSAVSVSNKAIEDYYDEHKQEFKQEKARNIEYVVFTATPTAQDTADDLQWVKDIKSDFAKAENIGQFVRVNSEEPFDATYYHENEMEDSVLNEFAFNNEEGAIYGSYKKAGSFRLAKIADIRQLPDSARAAQVVLMPQQRSRQAVQQLRSRADSLKQVIEEGEDFATIARQYSSGQNAQAGGNLGWFSMEDQPRALADTVFFNDPGDVKLVNTQQGIRIVQIQEHSPKGKAVQLAKIVRNIEPSEETLDRTFSKANKFAAENNTYEKFSQQAQQEGLTKRVANNLEPLAEEIGNVSNAREVVQWAYKAKVGNVSSVFEIQDKFIIASLTAAREKGIAPIEQVRSVITSRLKDKAKVEKLAEQISETAANSNNLFDIAQSLNAAVENASNVSFSAYQIEGLGYEPKVIGTAYAMEEGEQAGPVQGNTGAYLLELNTIQPAPEDANIFMNQRSMQTNYRRRTNMQMYNAIKEAVNFEDKRAKFY